MLFGDDLEISRKLRDTISSIATTSAEPRRVLRVVVDGEENKNGSCDLNEENLRFSIGSSQQCNVVVQGAGTVQCIIEFRDGLWVL